MLLEILNIKRKLAYSCSTAQQTSLLIALLALYESVIARDTAAIDGAQLVEWKSVMDAAADEEEKAA